MYKRQLIWFASPAVFDANYASGTGNSYLFNAILTKTCEKNDRISLIGKEMSQSYLTVTPVQQRTFITVCCIAIPVCTIIAVSYTHLDVYKRQASRFDRPLLIW